MMMEDSSDPGSLEDAISRFECRMRLPNGFYGRLRRDDDWSFVIKLCALFEAGCTHVLASRLHCDSLVDSFASLSLLDRSTGKVVLLRKLGALTPEQASFIRFVGELRNDLAHDITRVDFSFSKYVGEKDANQIDELVKKVGYNMAESVDIGGRTIPLREFIKSNLKLSLWLVAEDILGCLYLEFQVAELRERAALMQEYERLGGEVKAIRSDGSAPSS